MTELDLNNTPQPVDKREQLADLVRSSEGPYNSDSLTEVFWPGLGPKKARPYLSTLVRQTNEFLVKRREKIKSVKDKGYIMVSDGNTPVIPEKAEQPESTKRVSDEAKEYFVNLALDKTINNFLVSAKRPPADYVARNPVRMLANFLGDIGLPEVVGGYKSSEELKQAVMDMLGKRIQALWFKSTNAGDSEVEKRLIFCMSHFRSKSISLESVLREKDEFFNTEETVSAPDNRTRIHKSHKKAK
jgi:hypothetical protein